MKKENKRDETFDIAKGVAFLSVVWGHFISRYGTDIVYTFNLPLFYFVSGWFLNNKKPYSIYVKEKFKQLIIPYLITGSLLVLIMGFKGEGFIRYLKAFFYAAGLVPKHPLFDITFIGPVWFFPSLFFGLLIARYFIEKKYGFFFVFIITTFFIFLSDYVFFPFSIQAGTTAALVIFTGFLLRSLNERIKPYINDKKLFFSILMVLSFMIFLLSFSKNKGMPFYCINEFPRGYIDIITSIVMIIFIITLSSVVLKNIPGINTFLSFVGRNTLFLLCVHTIDTMANSYSFITNNLDASRLSTLLLLFIIKITIYTALTLLYNKFFPLLKERIDSKD